MRKRTLIRMSLMLGSVCMTAWQLPMLLEKFEAIKGQSFGLPTAVRASDIPAGTPVENPVQPGELVVFSPDGSKLTPEQVEELKKKAAAQAPINSVRQQPAPGAKPGAPGEPAQIGSPNPKVEELLKQLQDMQKSGDGSR